ARGAGAPPGRAPWRTPSRAPRQSRARVPPAGRARAPRSAVQLGALVAELARLLLEAHVERLARADVARGRELADLLGDLHRAEARAAHRAEVRGLGRLLRQGRVVVGARGLRVEREGELVVPAELEACPAQRVVARLRAG